MDVFEKLKILTDAAKYDVSCCSSGSDRRGAKGGIGNTTSAGICHSFAADGRCISLLKILMSNACSYDCSYCVNRRSNDTPRATFTPREIADLTIQFYRRNYIEGLFLSSGVLGTPDNTTERMISAISILRSEYRFNGYIHAKAIPGTDSRLIASLGMLVDRMSVNIELPSSRSLQLLAPDKTKNAILTPMGSIRDGIAENRTDIVKYRHAPKFVPGGQSTQMIVGATEESDFQILNLASGLYKRYGLKRVYYSAYIPMMTGRNLPARNTKPPLLREHRLYQADWLLRYYGFSAEELLDEKNPNFNPLVDPKCSWALSHMEFFPVEANTAPYELILRVPGIGVKSARRIVYARKSGRLDFDALKKLGVVIKRAQYFVTCGGKAREGVRLEHGAILRGLLSDRSMDMLEQPPEQLSLFDPVEEDRIKCLTGQI